MTSIDQLDISIRNGLRILIYPHSKDAKCFYESEAKAFGESVWQLQEGKEYEYEFIDDDGNPADAYFAKSNDIVTPRRRRNEGTIRTGIYVGTLKLFVHDPQQSLEHSLELEIQSIKTDYRTDYRIMLEDITKYYIDLIMNQSSPISQKFEVDDETDSNTLYQKFAFIKSMIESDIFKESIHKILQNPIRKWVEKSNIKRIENTRRLGRSAVRQIISRPDRIPYNNIEGLSTVSRHIIDHRKQDTINSNENQFVKYVLSIFYDFCSNLKSKKNASSQLKKEINITCNMLIHYLNMSFFKEIEKPGIINLNSPVLQRKDGYREILQTWLFFDLSAKLNWEGGDNVYEAGKRNVAALYEYWLFFKLLEIISNVFNFTQEDKSQLVKFDDDQINLDIKQGVMKVIHGTDNSSTRKLNIAFYYNRTFACNNDIHKNGSWTMPMRPDYTLSIWPGDISETDAEKEELIVHIHFDAKYRVHNLYLDDNVEFNNENNALSQELLLEKEEQEKGIYKRADILKMHAYKDAIRRTNGAYILYPGNKQNIRKGFHEIIPGLGAFCISPGKGNDQINELIDFILKIKNHMLNRISQREQMAYQTYRIYNKKTEVVKESLPESYGDNRGFMPDSTYVLVGYVKNKNHYDWITSNSLYNGRIGNRNGSLEINEKIASAKYLLLYGKKGTKRCSFYKLKPNGPRVFTHQELKNMNYPFNHKLSSNYIYLIFKFEQAELEFQKYNWINSKIKGLLKSKGHNTFSPVAIKLKDLLEHTD